MNNNKKITQRKRVSLTIRGDIILQAKALNLNASQAAEAGIAAAVKNAQEIQWLKENKSAIEAYNTRMEQSPPLLRPDWFKGEW